MSLSSFRKDLAAPGVKSADAVQSDSEDLEVFPKSLWINTDGVIVGVLAQDPPEAQPRSYTVVAGTPLPLVFRRITTATTAGYVPITL